MSEHCFECGREAEYDHHVVPRSQGGLQTVPLCSRCHALVHGYPEKMTSAHLTRAALSYKKANGKKTGGYCPYGYQVDQEGRLVQDQVESQVVDLILESWEKGWNYSVIARHINNKGHRTKLGKQWRAQQVKNVILR